MKEEDEEKHDEWLQHLDILTRFHPLNKNKKLHPLNKISNVFLHIDSDGESPSPLTATAVGVSGTRSGERGRGRGRRRPVDTSEYKAAWEQQEREEEEEERQEVERFAQDLDKELEGAFDDLEITVSEDESCYVAPSGNAVCTAVIAGHPAYPGSSYHMQDSHLATSTPYHAHGQQEMQPPFPQLTPNLYQADEPHQEHEQGGGPGWEAPVDEKKQEAEEFIARIIRERGIAHHLNHIEK